ADKVAGCIVGIGTQDLGRVQHSHLPTPQSATQPNSSKKKARGSGRIPGQAKMPLRLCQAGPRLSTHTSPLAQPVWPHTDAFRPKNIASQLWTGTYGS